MSGNDVFSSDIDMQPQDVMSCHEEDADKAQEDDPVAVTKNESKVNPSIPDHSCDDDYNSDMGPMPGLLNVVRPFDWKTMEIWSDEALKRQRRWIETADQDRIEQVRQQQIELLGSEKLYERVNKNFKLLRFEAYFASDQFKLYTWRNAFFYEQFGNYYDFDKRRVGSWRTMGYDDSHSFDTVPFQITQHFDDVVALASSNRDPKERIYFECDELKASKARNLFYVGYVNEDFLDPESLEDNGLSFGDALHMIAAAFPSQPLKLGHIAMKKTLEVGVPLTVLPRSLQEKAEKGMFETSGQLEQFIDEQGKELLKKVTDNCSLYDCLVCKSNVVSCRCKFSDD